MQPQATQADGTLVATGATQAQPKKPSPASEYYRRVMARAKKRGVRVIWVNPPRRLANEERDPLQGQRELR